ncbi:MAG: hypothetical protein QOJ58_4328 [Alphaproteobacteria bacterium]|nr:hypothetical protein [Alphaproteobacteria bacterium]
MRLLTPCSTNVTTQQLSAIGRPTTYSTAITSPYVQNNRVYIPNYGERYRHNETISTGFVESIVNQVVSKRFVKKQQMQWTPRGAHLLLQTRTKVLNGDLEQAFRGWYPAFRHDAEELAA